VRAAVKVVRVDLATGECTPGFTDGYTDQDNAMYTMQREGWTCQGSQITANGAYSLLTFTRDGNDD
jgi:hypothetical protein